MNGQRTYASEGKARREDFALEHVQPDFTAPGVKGLSGVILGIPSALVFLAVGGALEQAYGTVTLVTALAVAAVIIGYAGWILTSFACRSGLNSDLMSIPAGFGLKGSAITSAIYSVNFVVLFALEDSIVASAVHARYPDIPRAAVLVGMGLIVLLLAWWGVSSMAPAMALTLPFFVLFVGLACIQAARTEAAHGSFWSYTPANKTLDVTTWLSAVAVLMVFIVNATVAADIGRFLPPQRQRVGAFLFGGVLQVVSFGGAALVGGWLSWRLRGNSNPGLYLPALLGGWGIVCVLLSQGRINLINVYSGSLSLSNFGARSVGRRPGRHVWMVVLVVASTLLAMTRLYEHLLAVLTFEAVFVLAWAATLVAYIIHCKPPPDRGGLGVLDRAPAVNLVGIGALAGTLAIVTPLAFGSAGDLGRALAPLVACVVAPGGVVVASRIVAKNDASQSSASGLESTAAR